MDGQMSIFDFQEYLPEDISDETEEKPRNLSPMFGNIRCEHSSKHLCNRWHGGDEYIRKCKADLPQGFSCSGCCYNCSEAPQHNGKCKFDCRVMVDEYEER